MKSGPEFTGRLIRGGEALGVGVVVASALIHFDGKAGKRRWPSSKSQLVGVPSPDVEELSISYPGIGSMDGRNQAAQLGRLITAPNAHFEYSTDHVSVRGLAHTMQNVAPGARRVHIGGHSMGGPLGLESTRKADLEGKKLGHVVLFGSPFGIKDGKSGRASQVLRAVKWAPGPGHKFVFQAARGMLEGRSVRTSIDEARREVKEGCSPRVWLSMLGILQGVQLQKHVGEYQEMVDEETEFSYCMPEDPDRDQAVYTVAASEQYGEFCEAIGARYRIYQVPDIGHAEVGPSIDHMLQMMDDGQEPDPLELAA
jgi:hypothetical protein